MELVTVSAARQSEGIARVNVKVWGGKGAAALNNGPAPAVQSDVNAGVDGELVAAQVKCAAIQCTVIAEEKIDRLRAGERDGRGASRKIGIGAADIGVVAAAGDSCRRPD